MIMLFLLIYYNTSGPLAWMYAAETNVDVAVGISILTLWGTALLLCLISPILMEDKNLGPSNVFFLFSVLSIFGAWYA